MRNTLMRNTCAQHPPLSQVRDFVDETMELVDLSELMNNLVGTPGVNGLSVEQVW